MIVHRSIFVWSLRRRRTKAIRTHTNPIQTSLRMTTTSSSMKITLRPLNRHQAHRKHRHRHRHQHRDHPIRSLFSAVLMMKNPLRPHPCRLSKRKTLRPHHNWAHCRIKRKMRIIWPLICWSQPIRSHSMWTIWRCRKWAIK